MWKLIFLLIKRVKLHITPPNIGPFSIWSLKFNFSPKLSNYVPCGPSVHFCQLSWLPKWYSAFFLPIFNLFFFPNFSLSLSLPDPPSPSFSLLYFSPFSPSPTSSHSLITKSKCSAGLQSRNSVCSCSGPGMGISFEWEVFSVKYHGFYLWIMCKR